jgi:hypothetical protein
MSTIKFHHVFAALLVLSFLSAFVIPARYTTRIHPQVQSLFYPVARPVRGVAGWIDGKLAKPDTADARDARTLAEENDQLRQDKAVLVTLIDELQRRIDERAKFGPIADDCTQFQVFANDAAGREGLLLRGSTFEGLRQGQYVLFAGGVAGILERPPGVAGAQVRLITDRGVRVGACFKRWETDPKTNAIEPRRLDTPPALVEGLGQNAMHCATSLTMQEVEKAGLKPGDWVVVEDNDWDPRLQGRRLGKVARVAPQATQPLYADIRIEPTTNLMNLRDVMVLTK